MSQIKRLAKSSMHGFVVVGMCVHRGLCLKPQPTRQSTHEVIKYGCLLIGNLMKFYERLDPTERKKLVLNAVAVDAAMEGMSEATEDCLRELRALDRGELSVTLLESAGQKSE